MIDRVMQALRPQVMHRVWVMSDLQQAIPSQARRCMSAAANDFNALEMPVDQIWYLGDAVEGLDIAALREMAAMQVEMLGRFGAPVKYVLGNHDFDYLTKEREHAQTPAVFRDAVRGVPGWRTIDDIESFYFRDKIGPFTTLFMSDHADANGRWISTHGSVYGDKSLYPHSADKYIALRDELARVDGPVITCSHYSFAGGNRPSELHNQMLPLPGNVRLHLYGHAHIGDKTWAGKDWGRKIACVDDQMLVQVDIASLEDGRGSAIRSAVLEIYQDLTLGLFFRNHTTRLWEESLVLNVRP